MKKNTALSILLFIFAALLAIYALWSAVQTFVYIQSLFADGAQLGVDFRLYDIVQYCFSQFGTPFVFALLLLAGGWLTMETVPAAAPAPEEAPEEEIAEDLLEEDREPEEETPEKPEE